MERPRRWIAALWISAGRRPGRFGYLTYPILERLAGKVGLT